MNEKQEMLIQMTEYLDGTYDDNSLLNYRSWFVNHYLGIDTNYDQLKDKLLNNIVTKNDNNYQLIDTNRLADLLINDEYIAGKTKLPTTIEDFLQLVDQNQYFELKEFGFKKL